MVNFGVENFCSTCSSFSNKIEVNIKLSLLARTVSRLQEVDFLVFSA